MSSSQARNDVTDGYSDVEFDHDGLDGVQALAMPIPSNNTIPRATASGRLGLSVGEGTRSIAKATMGAPAPRASVAGRKTVQVRRLDSLY